MFEEQIFKIKVDQSRLDTSIGIYSKQQGVSLVNYEGVTLELGADTVTVKITGAALEELLTDAGLVPAKRDWRRASPELEAALEQWLDDDDTPDQGGQEEEEELLDWDEVKVGLDRPESTPIPTACMNNLCNCTATIRFPEPTPEEQAWMKKLTRRTDRLDRKRVETKIAVFDRIKKIAETEPSPNKIFDNAASVAMLKELGAILEKLY